MGRPDGLPEDLPINLQKGCNYGPMPTGCARPVDKDVQSFTNMQLPLRFRMGHHHLPQKMKARCYLNSAEPNVPRLKRVCAGCVREGQPVLVMRNASPRYPEMQVSRDKWPILRA